MTATLEEKELQNTAPASLQIAVLIPCRSEALTIGRVIDDFRKELPRAAIYVFDNNSTDGSADEVRRAGAQIMYERRQGKGHVVRSMFRRVKADVYVMVDGDGTYPASAVRDLIQPIINGEADMVIGSRLHEDSRSEFRWLNLAGNRLFCWFLARIFNQGVGDLLSGYRAFSRRFVAGTPLFAGGFDTEAEMTIRALARGLRIVEIPVDLSPRPPGSHSKIRVVRDGLVILRSMLALFRDYKPLSFFGAIGLFLIALGFVPGTIVIVQYLRTGLIFRIPSAILAVGLTLSGLIFIVVGIILHVIAQRFRELDFQLELLSHSVHTSDRP